MNACCLMHFRTRTNWILVPWVTSCMSHEGQTPHSLTPHLKHQGSLVLIEATSRYSTSDVAVFSRICHKRICKLSGPSYFTKILLILPITTPVVLISPNAVVTASVSEMMVCRTGVTERSCKSPFYWETKFCLCTEWTWVLAFRFWHWTVFGV